MQRIYMDHAATTPILPEIIYETNKLMEQSWGNPSSKHTEGRGAEKHLSRARTNVSKLLGCHEREVIFTSGGTEADSLGLVGAALALPQNRQTIVVSAIEHDAVANAAKYLIKLGFKVYVVQPSNDGVILPESIEKVMSDEVGIVSVMLVNHETGAIQPIEAISKIAHAHGALMMSDAVQGAPFLDLTQVTPHCDLLTFSSHKIGGPEGIGCLYIREGTRVEPLLFGGHQEGGLRPGTENTIGIIGFGMACEQLVAKREERINRAAHLKEILVSELKKQKGVHFHAEHVSCSPSHISVSFDGMEGEVMVAMLDRRGIACSTGAACRESAGTGSPILRAMGVPEDQIRTAVRLTLGWEQTDEMMLETASKIADAREKYQSVKM